tara:strand:- start:377 stop:583 length:207 start_codon:yes stop_codon:yes gene_type:complete
MRKLKECISDGVHLTDCDNDGFCNHCGHQDSIRDLLEKQIVEDAIAGDTTVLAELLTFIDDEHIKGAL